MQPLARAAASREGLPSKSCGGGPCQTTAWKREKTGEINAHLAPATHLLLLPSAGQTQAEARGQRSPGRGVGGSAGQGRQLPWCQNRVNESTEQIWMGKRGISSPSGFPPRFHPRCIRIRTTSRVCFRSRLPGSSPDLLNQNLYLGGTGICSFRKSPE